jgi:hypothetical protein
MLQASSSPRSSLQASGPDVLMADITPAVAALSDLLLRALDLGEQQLELVVCRNRRHPVNGLARTFPDTFSERDIAELGGWGAHFGELLVQLAALCGQDFAGVGGHLDMVADPAPNHLSFAQRQGSWKGSSCNGGPGLLPAPQLKELVVFSSHLTARVAVAGALVFTVGQLALSAPSEAASMRGAPPSQAQAGRAAPVGWITGVVVDAEGRPVQGALVNAVRPDEVPEVGIIKATSDRRDWTNANGRFRVRQAAQGYLVQICQVEPRDKRVCRETAQGVDYRITYVGPAGVTDSWVLQTSLFEADSADRKIGEVTVKPQSVIHGRIKGAKFQLVELLRLNGTVAYRMPTDADGDYRIPGLAPGSYRVHAGGNGWLSWTSGVVTVASDGTAEVNGRVRRGGSISGVLSSHGQQVSFVDVTIRDADGDVVAIATTNARGVYRASGFVPGDYRVGIMYDGSDYLRKSVRVTIPEPNSKVERDLRVRRGAVLTIDVFDGTQPVRRLTDELRDASGTPILGFMNDGRGRVRYTGLAKGTYTFVAATDSRYVKKKIVIGAPRRYDVGDVKLNRDTFTLSGTTAPGAVVEAMTGNQCLPDGPDRAGSFHRLELANAAGRYEIHGLVPGNYMLGSAGWPNNYVPRCIPDVRLVADTVRNLPLPVGGTVSGRLVYAATGGPVITPLAYQLSYPFGSPNQPTDEQPSRALTRGATGEFFIDALGADTVTGQLSQGASAEEQINDEEFFVMLPYQDGTPYYLTSEQQAITVGPGLDVDLGDIEVTLNQAPL